MRRCDTCGALLIGRATRCHVCATVAQAKVREQVMDGRRGDFGRGVIHDPRHEEPGCGAVGEAEAIIRAVWMEHSGEGWGE